MLKIGETLQESVCSLTRNIREGFIWDKDKNLEDFLYPKDNLKKIQPLSFSNWCLGHYKRNSSPEKDTVRKEF